MGEGGESHEEDLEIDRPSGHLELPRGSDGTWTRDHKDLETVQGFRG